MINVGEDFKEGVVAQSRRVKLKAIVDLTPTGIVFGSVNGSEQSVNSKSDQIHNKDFDSYRAISSELNRWIIDEPFNAYTRLLTSETGYETVERFDEEGNGNFFVEVNFSNVPILQGCHIFFPNNTTDGFGVDFVLTIKSGDSVLFSRTYTNNTESDIFIYGFTIYYPTSIRLDVSKWSIPNRRMRIPEFVVGEYDVWFDDKFATFNIQQRSSFTAFSLPYTTCEVEIDNSKRIFDPTNKQGMFLSLEERQPIELYASVNSVKYYPIGTYYHYSGGWKTGNSTLSLKWNLVDLIGLLVDRKFDTSGFTPPTILKEWIHAIVAQLGEKFADLYEVPDEYANIPITTTLDKIKNHTCGEILQWACQATQTWPRAVSNGKLYVGKFERYGQSDLDLTVKLSYDNLNKYPVLKANDDIARLDYRLNDSDTYSVAGTSDSSPTTQSIDNPFITTESAANTSALYSLQFYGGNKIETTGRGNPSQEVGDLVYVEMSKGSYQAARVIEQTFQVNNHIMQSCQTVLLAVDNSATYDSFEVITEGDTDNPYIWTVPGNLALDGDVGKIKIVLVQAGWTGGHGAWKSIIPWDPDANGEPGPGGRIRVMNDVVVTRGMNLEIVIGKAAPPDDTQNAKEGGHSTITINGSVFSSQQGTQYTNGLVEPISAKILGRSTQEYPAQNSGDGGGAGTEGQAIHHDATPETEYDYAKPAYDELVYPTQGVKGADGCVIICYATEEVSVDAVS